jgi:hypothetical protein
MSNSTGQSGNTNAADTRTDPAMKALYHMSRTAGVGLGDYAAVNVLSVIGLIVGVSCCLLLIFGESLIMLLLPAVAVIICVVAILQIRGSNGTQVGTLLAGSGLVLALAFGGINVGGRVKAANLEKSNRSQIAGLVERLSNAATTQSTVPQSYELFHKRFKDQVNPETFARTIAMRTGLLANSPIAGITLGDSVLFETNPDTKVITATALIVLTAKQKDEHGRPLKVEFPAGFRRDPNEEWKIYAIPDWFGKEDPQAGG